ncbi:uncharacterized protein BDFB_007699, partial [Asbolus verrucosus]
MKLLLVLFCGLVACNAAELDKEFVMKFVQKIKQVSEDCTAETKASQDDIKTLLEHKIPDSHEGKCMIFCFHKHFHIQNEDGSLNKIDGVSALEAIKEHNREVYDKVVQVYSTCTETAATDSDPCVYASHLAECAVHEGKS